jgi:hypothetical protein
MFRKVVLKVNLSSHLNDYPLNLCTNRTHRAVNAPWYVLLILFLLYDNYKF